MSVILDALKKLEREKVASRGGAVDIVPEMLSPHKRRSPSGKWTLVMVILAAVCLTAVATFFVMGHIAGSNHQPDRLAAQVDRGAFAPQASVGPQVDQKNNVGEGEIVREVREKNAPVKSAQAAPAPLRRSFPQRDQDVQMLKSDSPPMVGGAAPSPFTVSGIAWQEARSDRRAVVNGALVGEGATVEDARIVRIYQDRVRFSRGGQTFDVAVSGGAAMGK